jgi:hypothetical protein
MNKSFHRKFIARCGRQETAAGAQAALATNERFLTIGSTFNWRFEAAHWYYPATIIWKERVNHWFRRLKLSIPVTGIHLRVCDQLAKRWQRSRNTGLTRDMTAPVLSTLEAAMNHSRDSTVYIASELYPGACEWNVVADIAKRLNILCIDGSMLKLDDETKVWVRQGHGWIPDFMALTHITSSLEFVFMSPDCLSVESGTDHFRSSFSRMILHTRLAVEHRDRQLI